MRAPPIVTHRYLPARLQRLSGYMRQARSHAHSAGARAVSGLRSCGLADPQQFQDRRRSFVPEKLQSHAELIKYSPLIGTAHVVCGAGSINRRGVRLSVRPSVCLSHSPAAAACCGFAAVGPASKGHRLIATACVRSNAGSATLSAYTYVAVVMLICRLL